MSLVLLLATGGTARAEDSDATRLAAELGNTIRSGKAPERGEDVSWGTAVGVVDAPVDAVTRVVTDYARYEGFVPHFKKSKVLSRRGDDALVYMEAGIIKNSVTLWAQVRITARTEGNRRVVEGRMLQGNMDAFRARWELMPVAGDTRTLVRFQLLVDPDLPLPSSVFDHENRKGARKTVRALRGRVAHAGVAVANNR
ncbi:MAG: type II toxin-antitoxin system RatA family toxin [Myxococcota bacterium]